MKIRLFLPAILLALGCSTSTTKRLNLPDLPVVAHVDVERYVGTWFEIASFPQSFQEGCTATTATYKLRDDGELDVINRCKKGGLDGEDSVAKGRARIVDSKTNAKLEVSFFRPFWGDYWIIDLADDYSYAVVGHPGRDYLWILSRTPQMEPTIYEGIIERLKGNEYEVERLNKTLQPAAEKATKVEPEAPTLETFKKDPPTSIAAPDSVGGALAQRVLAFDLATTNEPGEVLKGLELPTEVKFPWPTISGVFKTDFESPEGPITLTLVLKPGTWKQPVGDYPAPAPLVDGIELSGANGVSLYVPRNAQTLLFDGDSVRRFHVWGDYSYFEQGSTNHGWTVAKYAGRAPFHTTAAERDALEDALMLFTDQIKAGTKDLQTYAAKEFADRKTAENTYDFGVGEIQVTFPHSVAASWHGPTQIPNFFKKVDVDSITTGFAHDAGMKVQMIKLDGLVINPTDYFIIHPDSIEDEMGAATEAKFRGLTFYIPRERL